MKKQLLFLMTLILAITPACRKPLFQKPTFHKDSELIAGSVFTGVGGATGIAAGAIAGSSMIFGTAIATIIVLPISIGLLCIGIPLVVVGAHKRNKLNKQRLLEKIKEEAPTKEKSEEIQINNSDNFIINEK